MKTVVILSAVQLVTTVNFSQLKISRVLIDTTPQKLTQKMRTKFVLLADFTKYVSLFFVHYLVKPLFAKAVTYDECLGMMRDAQLSKKYCFQSGISLHIWALVIR